MGRSLFVDNLAIWWQSVSLASAQRQVQMALNKLEAWSATSGFKFSSTKTVAMHFCRLRNCEKSLNLTIYKEEIPVVNSIKFLGIIFDHSLL